MHHHFIDGNAQCGREFFCRTSRDVAFESRSGPVVTDDLFGFTVQLLPPHPWPDVGTDMGKYFANQQASLPDKLDFLIRFIKNQIRLRLVQKAS